MSRKSSLLDISKAYEQVLNEQNIGIPSQGQDVLIKNMMPMQQGAEQNEIEFVVPKPSPEQMQQATSQMDANREECQSCKTGQCNNPSHQETEVSHEEGCEECESDHSEDHNPNLDMAKSEVYKIFKSAEKLMHLMKKSNKMEAWMLSKIIKASDYMCSVSSVLEYDEYEKEVQKPCDDFSNDMHLITKITGMLNGEGREVNEQVLRRVIFNLELLKEIK